MNILKSLNATNVTKNRIVREYVNHIEKIISSRDDLTPYFVTTVFRYCNSDLSFDLTSKQTLRNYGVVYRHVTSQLINHWSKKRHLHPLTFDFLDVPNSRRSKKQYPGDPLTPHYHSIYLVNTRTQARWDALISDDFRSVIRHPAMAPLISIKALPIVPEDFRKTIAYSCKLLESPAMLAELNNANEAMINQFPITKEEQTVRKLGLRQERALLNNDILRRAEALQIAPVLNRQPGEVFATMSFY